MRDPLESMKIRTADLDQASNQTSVTSRLNYAASPVGGSYGKVRSAGKKFHAGWDLYADIGTLVYAVGAGVVEYQKTSGDYGVQVCLRLTSASMDKRAKRAGASHLYAFYAHLSMAFVTKGQALLEGDIVGATGNTGNATNTPPHLHFEIRTQAKLPKGSGQKGRLDPGEVLGYEHYTSEP